MADQGSEAGRAGKGVAAVAAGMLAYAAAAWVIYAPALRGGWLWDDREDVPDNPILKLPGAEGLKRIWSGSAGLDYYPLKASVHWLEWRMFGGATTGYHAVNLALHVATAGLLWAILEKSGVRRAWAWAGGLLFLCHPVAVGSVAWMAELKDVLSMPLLLLSVLAWLAFEQTGKNRHYAASLAAFLAAMLAKSSVMMLPLWLALRQLTALPRKNIILNESAAGTGVSVPSSVAAVPVGRWLRVIPYLAITVACGWLAVVLQGQRSMGSDQAGLGGAPFRLALAAQTLWVYVRHVVWPTTMLPVYYRWPVPSGISAVISCWKLLPLLALAVWAWVKRASAWAQAVLLCGGWFVLNLAPVLGLIGISYMRFSWVMDHLAYISLAGAAALAAIGAQWLAARAAPAAIAAVAVATAIFAADSWHYAHAWQGEEQIWAYGVEHGPNLWMPAGNLGSVRLNQGRFEEAEKLLTTAIRLDPNAPDPHRNLGVLYDQKKNFPAAARQAAEALRLRPDYAMAENDLGTYLGQMGRYSESAPYLQAAVTHTPWDADARNKYGLVLGQLGRTADALQQLQAAETLAPGNPEIELNLGTALGKAGRIREALPHLELAAKLLPNNPQAQQNVMVARKLLGK